MAKPTVTFLVNTMEQDGANLGGAAGGAGDNGSDWLVVDRMDDALWFTSAQQQNGQAVTHEFYPVLVPTAGFVEAGKTFLADASAGVLVQIPLAGTVAGGQAGGNTQHVFCVHFSGPTVGAPYLEAWDDTTYVTCRSRFLGGNPDAAPPVENPANSTLHGVATTNGPPGVAAWAGTPLAGGTSRVALAAAALDGATCLYFNLRQAFPVGFFPAVSQSERLAVRYIYN